MAISSDLIRGHTDMIILANLMKEDSYGYRINREIQEKTNNMFELKEATLYSAFRRMEKEGVIRSYWGVEDLGARRRYYTITPEGRAAFAQYCKEWDQVKTTIDQLITL
ncbi:PadR family transcriptional regulator [Ruminococcaceae bacterium OttesenSCG-928-A16]|nr:PadR family transcriptional regulator [Ruminococcaceae bacterium OttesenSCG-928-A16]